MKPNFNLKTVYDSFFMRLAIAAGTMLIGLTLINAAKIHRFTPLTFAIFVLPYLVYFCLIYFGYRATLAQRAYRWLGFGLIVTAVLSSYVVVKYYFYDLVPQFMDGFTAPWLPEHKPVLISKIIGGLLIFLIIDAVDYLAWEWYFIRVEFRLAEAKIRNISNVQLLSGHFLGNVYDLLRPRGKRVRSSVLNFFQYVSNKITNPKVLVPVQEEWSYVRQLISFCTHRNFIVEGEELLDRKLLNRSIPTLTIMSWIENAVKYSPEDPNEWIELKWIKVVGGTQLQIRNRIAADNIEKGTGKGLALVNKLFESMKNQLIVLEYEIVDAKYFIVKLTLKTKSMAKYDVVIIDDDTFDIRMAESAFREIHQVGDIRSFTKAIDGFNSIIDNPPDVLLLDVEMPQMSGLDLYQTLPVEKRPPVILYTKSEQYAYEGIKIAVADYLIKPVKFPELYVAFKRALDQKNIHIKVDINIEPSGKWFSFKNMDRLVKFSDIVAVSSLKNYAVFHLRQLEEDFNYRLTMDEAEAMLPKSTFVRVHRGFIVNVNFATTIVDRKIVLPDRTDLDINVSDMGLIRLREYC